MLTSMGTSSCRLTLRGVDMANDERRAHVTTRARSLAHDNRADVLNNLFSFFSSLSHLHQRTESAYMYHQHNNIIHHLHVSLNHIYS